MKVMVIAATVLSILPVICALFMPDYYLGNTQNAVENIDLTGEQVAFANDSDSKAINEKRV